jgi:hypothetical protein
MFKICIGKNQGLKNNSLIYLDNESTTTLPIRKKAATETEEDIGFTDVTIQSTKEYMYAGFRIMCR